MVKKDLPPILKGSGKKPTIDCPQCFTQISHVEVVEERHGVMNIDGEIEYDLNSEQRGSKILLPRIPGRDRRSEPDTRSRAKRMKE